MSFFFGSLAFFGRKLDREKAGLYMVGERDVIVGSARPVV